MSRHEPDAGTYLWALVGLIWTATYALEALTR